MISPRIDGRPYFLVILVGLIGVAWLSLLALDSTPYARYLDHHSLAAGNASGIDATLFFIAGWTLMTFAMMLPTSLPLIYLFHRLMSRRTNRFLLMVLLVAGYLATWAVVGLFAHTADRGVHFAVESTPWLHARPWAISAATLVLAGIYQFTPLKYRCLDACRSPMSFITSHWHGRQPARDALVLGVSHGVFCVGCCWSLMLVMFAVGIGSIAWMLALAVVMGVEKNFAWGRRLSSPLGVLLLTSGVTVASLG